MFVSSLFSMDAPDAVRKPFSFSKVQTDRIALLGWDVVESSDRVSGNVMPQFMYSMYIYIIYIYDIYIFRYLDTLKIA